MINILVVEDDKPISDLIKMSLKRVGYLCDTALDGEIAIDKINEKTYDLILLDIMLPKVNVFEILEYIEPRKIPVIFLTAKNSVEDKVRGLRMGAEDYIVKPFETTELLARVDVVLRRYNKTDNVINIAGLQIDMISMKVSRDGKEILLTPKEYNILLLFAHNPNVALYRETIYERVWGEEYEYGTKTVDLHIQRLRKKVGWQKELKAVNKVGYRLEV